MQLSNFSAVTSEMFKSIQIYKNAQLISFHPHYLFPKKTKTSKSLSKHNDLSAIDTRLNISRAPLRYALHASSKQRSRLTARSDNQTLRRNAGFAHEITNCSKTKIKGNIMRTVSPNKSSNSFFAF